MVARSLLPFLALFVGDLLLGSSSFHLPVTFPATTCRWQAEQSFSSSSPNVAWTKRTRKDIHPQSSRWRAAAQSATRTASRSACSSTSSSSTRLYNHGGHHAGPEAELAHTMMINKLSHLGPLGAMMQSPIFWSTAIMVSIVALLFSWEKAVSSARESLPESIQPIVDSMLVEMGGLGFIGLFLSVTVVGGPLGGLLAAFSETFLGEEEILLEAFEFLHTSFFEVAVSFFLVAAITVLGVVKQIESLEQVSRAVFDLDGDGEVTLLEIAEVLNVESVTVDLDGDGELSPEEIRLAQSLAPRTNVFSELFKSGQDDRGEALVLRERLMEEYGIDDSTFELENYFVKIFSNNLQEMVELSPLTWLPMIPIIALGTSIDLSRSVVSASDLNAYQSCGDFLSHGPFLAAQTATVGVALIWGVWNFWKMVEIKNMLLPALVMDSGAEVPSAVLLPPRYENSDEMKKFNSSPFPFNTIESIWGKPATNDQESLFGAAGREGRELYKNSIKFNVWLVVAELVFTATQVVSRDASALIEGLPPSVGQPELVLPELAYYGFLSSLLIGQLLLIPKTFLDYSKVTSIEKFIETDILNEACVKAEECYIDVGPNGNPVTVPKDEVSKPETSSTQIVREEELVE